MMSIDDHSFTTSNLVTSADDDWEELREMKITGIERLEVDRKISRIRSLVVAPGTLEDFETSVRPISRSSSMPSGAQGPSNRLLNALVGEEPVRRKLPRRGSMPMNLNSTVKGSRNNLSSTGSTGAGSRTCFSGNYQSGYQSWSSSGSMESSSVSSRRSSVGTNQLCQSPSSIKAVPTAYRNQRMVIQIAQRSSSKEVKSILTQLADSSKMNEETVECHCSTLASVLSDSYYQVVISKYGGPAILCNVMQAFPNNCFIQESCCNCLERMAQHPHLQTHGGQILRQCLARQPASIHVQSSACQALAALLEQEGNDQLVIPNDLHTFFQPDSGMVLTAGGRRAAERIHDLLLERYGGNWPTGCSNDNKDERQLSSSGDKECLSNECTV